MAIRKDVVSLAVTALLAGAGFAMAEDGTSAAAAKASYLSLTPTVTMDEAAPDAPLMSGLDALGVGKYVKNAGFNIYGFVEVGYVYNFDHHAGVVNTGQGFTLEPGNHINLNQVDLTIERVVDHKKWDVGGKVEWTFGTDVHNYTDNALRFYDQGQVSPAYEFDLTQAYVDINAPVGNGLVLRLGKFVTPLGYETINPTQNPFYTHTYMFYNAIPFTQAGALLMYKFNDQWELDGGVTRGWGQSTSDNNGAIDGLIDLKFTPNAQWSFVLNESIGPQDPGDQKHYRTVTDGIAQWTPNSSWTFGAEALYGYDGVGDATGGSHWWAGAAGYAGYHLNEYLTLNGRVEYYYDGDGATTGLASFTGRDIDLNIFSGTAGVTIKPFPKNRWLQGLMIRPEVRYDWADRQVYIGGTSHDQLTVGADIIYTY